jgi:hypothetical protein
MSSYQLDQPFQNQNPWAFAFELLSVLFFEASFSKMPLIDWIQKIFFQYSFQYPKSNHQTI